MDWNDLQRLTAESLRVYEALRRAERLTEEGHRLLQEAEGLLRRAALAYLLESLPPEPSPAAEGSAAAAIAETWAQLQAAWADLKDSLYQMAKGDVEKRRNAARSILIALLQVEPGHREYEALLTETYLREAQFHFDKGELDEGCSVLWDAMRTQPVDEKRCRLAVLEALVNAGKFEELAEYEPRVRTSPAFQKAVTTFETWLAHLAHYPERPKSSVGGIEIRDWDDLEYLSRKREWDTKNKWLEIEMEEAKSRLRSVLFALVYSEEP